MKKLKPQKTRPDALPDVDIAAALKRCKGLQSLTAEMLNVSEALISARISKSPYLQQVRENCQQRRLDRAEFVLSEMVDDKNLGAVCFLLKTLGRSRGYIENTPIAVTPETIELFKETMKTIASRQIDLNKEDISINND